MELFLPFPKLAIAVALIGTLCLIPLLRQPAARFGLMDEPGGRKRHNGAVPLVGGLAMGVSFFAALAIYAPSSWIVVWLAAGMALLLIVGLLDDRRELGAGMRFLVQSVAAGLMVFGGVEITTLGYLFAAEPIELGLWAIPFTIACTVAVINAVNMLDGVDGLAGCVTVVMLGWIAVAAALNGAGANTIVPVLALMAAVAGFLIYNLQPEKNQRLRVFMGDSGSTMLGFAVAFLAVTAGLYGSAVYGNGQSPIPPIGIAWILLLPVTDTVALTLLRLTHKRNPMSPDRQHLHHILMRLGLGPRATVAVIVTVVACFGGFGVLGAVAGLSEAWLTGALIAVAMLHAGVIWQQERVEGWLRGEGKQ